MAKEYGSVFTYNLLELTLINYKNEKVDITELFEEINIYEDIFNNTMSADIVIMDARGLIEEFPIIGEETLIIKYQKYGDKTVSLNFRLYNITDFTIVKENVQVYTLHFISSESITNQKVKLSKSYTGTISNTVEKIYKEYLNNGKQILIEPTKQLKRLVIPNYSPFTAINWLSSMALSQSKNGSNYVFYEDYDGFKFLSIESLMTSKVTVEYIYNYSNLLKYNTMDSLEQIEDQYSILNISTNQQFDIMKNLNNGLYGSELITADIVRRNYKKFNFKYDEEFNKFVHIDNNKLCSERTDLINTQSKSKFIVSDYDRNMVSHLISKQEQLPLNKEYNIQKRIYQLNEISNGQVYSLTVPGDTDRRVGDIIEINLHSFMLDNSKFLNSMSSGRYLITSIRRTIRPDKMVMHMEVVKDGYSKKFT